MKVHSTDFSQIALFSVFILLSCALPMSVTADSFDMNTVLEEEYAGIRAELCPDPDRVQIPLELKFDYQKYKLPPKKVFDNLYFLGIETNSSWALTTSDGIILFDTMTEGSVQSIIDGFQTLGLDLNDIKYMVLGHGHNDHFGGSTVLQRMTGARIVMSAEDWKHIKVWEQKGIPAPIPEDDIAIVDGDTLTLGDTTIRFVAPSEKWNS